MSMFYSRWDVWDLCLCNVWTEYTACVKRWFHQGAVVKLVCLSQHMSLSIGQRFLPINWGFMDMSICHGSLICLLWPCCQRLHWIGWSTTALFIKKERGGSILPNHTCTRLPYRLIFYLASMFKHILLIWARKGIGNHCPSLTCGWKSHIVLPRKARPHGGRECGSMSRVGPHCLWILAGQPFLINLSLPAWFLASCIQL